MFEVQRLADDQAQCPRPALGARPEEPNFGRPGPAQRLCGPLGERRAEGLAKGFNDLLDLCRLRAQHGPAHVRVPEGGLDDGERATEVLRRGLAAAEARGSGEEALPSDLDGTGHPVPTHGGPHQRRQLRQRALVWAASASACEHQLVLHELRGAAQPGGVERRQGKQQVLAELRGGGARLLVRRLEQMQEILLADVVVHETLQLLGQSDGRLGALPLLLRLNGLGGALEQDADDPEHRGDHDGLPLAAGRCGLVRLMEPIFEQRGGELDPIRHGHDVLQVCQQRQQGQWGVLHEVVATRHLLHQVLVEQ
mmetsp:Transcript_125288/g.359883  ORF Transcript_125288/g.359883 Transcript_125288/m.359883 type:complete len:310 (+) Transcript_125288:1378-2307(+)